MPTSNANRPFGLRPAGFIGGAKWTGETQLYAFSASQANNAFVGDLVTFDATNRSVAITDPNFPGTPMVAPVVAALTTTPFRGVIAGFIPEPEYSNSPTASLGLQYRVASTARLALIVDNPQVVFEAQETGQSYVTALNNGVNKTGDISYTAGNTLTGVSGVQLAAPQTVAVRPLRWLRYTNRPDNFGFVAADNPSYAHFDVVIANSDLANGNIGA